MGYFSQYRRLIRFVFPHAWVLAMAGVCMVAGSALSGVSIGMIIPLVDNIIAGKKIAVPSGIPLPSFIQALIDKANAMSPMELLNSMIIIVMVLWLLKNVFEFFQSYLMNDVSQRVVRDVKNIIYKKLLTLSMDFYATNSTGKLMSRVTYDAAVIRDSISTGLTDLIYQPVQLVVYIAMLIAIKVYFSIPLSLILISLFLFSLVVYPVVKIGKRLKSISRQTQEKIGDITTTLHETISGVRVVKAFSMEAYEAKKFENQNQYFYKLSMKAIKRMAVVSPITEFVGMLCIAIILWIAGKNIVSGELSAGAFITFLASMLSLMRPIKRLTNVYSINQQAMAAADRIFDVLDTTPTVSEKKDAIELPKISKSVKLKDVHFGYDDKEVLKGINIDTRVGDVIAFVGSSGAGKTTILNLIPRFYDPNKGRILVDGTDIKEVTFRSLRYQIGIVTQETILFNDSIKNNILYGKPDVSMQEVEEAARQAHAHDFISCLPSGYDTIIGDRGVKLSGGERQRLAIARALLKNPPILILDEATSQLDTESERLVQEALNRLIFGRTVFVIAHRLSTVKNANMILVLDKGRIVEQGNHQQLLALGGLYQRLYQMQELEK